MFALHTSNRTENLLAHLEQVIDSIPLSSPFSKETFLIQSQGMERWLSQQLALRFKVWGNFEYLFPGKFFSVMAQSLDSRLNNELFDRELMLWHFEIILRNLGHSNFTPLQTYIQGNNSALKRYQLARQLAQVFDQYQMMRPDMLMAWEQGKSYTKDHSENWQRLLWQELVKRLGSNHRGALWMDAIATLKSAQENSMSTRLPERIIIFGLNTMPPLFLEFLSGLALQTQIHLFLLNPCQSYWADLANRRQLARHNTLNNNTRSVGDHPLLAALGQQGREFQQLLLEHAEFEMQFESFEPADEGSSNNLQYLQNEILNNQLTETEWQNDGSLCIHSCHSRMREVQVLKNQLLEILEKDQAIELRDIIVMAPDIQVYEPFIAAIFEDIQYAIADRSMRNANTVLDIFTRFLRLSQSRFGWHEVLDLLEHPLIYPAFDLSETDLEQIRQWVEQTNIRWGRSGEHKVELGLPPTSENTWQTGLDRLLMGYAFEDDQDFINEILPYPDMEGSSALPLGGFHDFVLLLFDASEKLAAAKPFSSWAGILFSYTERLFSPTSIEASKIQELNQLLVEMGEALSCIHNEDIELDVLTAWLEDSVQERKSSTGFLRGQLTFCSMLPMRSIPFQIIALLGMNEGEFPSIDRHPAFDLIAQDYRPGDRSRRADDRYQFLEILLSARQKLIITYIGQSLSRNEPVQPAVVIGELLYFLQTFHRLTDLVIKHPMQSFSPRYFEGADDLFSYSEPDCQTAIAMNNSPAEPSAWWRGEITMDEPNVVEIGDFLRFFRHPQRYFVQQKLALRLNGIDLKAEEREPFTIDTLNAYQINQNWVSSLLSEDEWPVNRLQAQGRWLSGICGEIEYEKRVTDIEIFAESIRTKNPGEPLEDLSIDIEIEGCRLVGKLSHCYQNGSLFFRYAKLKGSDFIQAWLHHLIINQVQPQKTWLIGNDEDLLFEPEYCQPGDLIQWLTLYQEGLKRPDVFFIDPAFAYIRQAEKLKLSNRAKTSAIEEAAEQLTKSIAGGFDQELKLLFGNLEDPAILLGDEFEQSCQILLLPVWEAAHGH